MVRCLRSSACKWLCCLGIGGASCTGEVLSSEYISRKARRSTMFEHSGAYSTAEGEAFFCGV